MIYNEQQIMLGFAEGISRYCNFEIPISEYKMVLEVLLECGFTSVTTCIKLSPLHHYRDLRYLWE